jgi:hypothetical protein
MAQGILFVLSEPVSEADDAAYNEWYDHTHLPEVLALPGFSSARRFRMSEVQLESQGGLESVSSQFPSRYVATYEVEGPDLELAAKALTEASPRVHRQSGDGLRPHSRGSLRGDQPPLSSLLGGRR